MPRWQNGEVGWQRKKHDAKDKMLGKYHDEFQKGRGRHETHNTKLKNGFQWCEQHTLKNWLYLVCLTQ